MRAANNESRLRIVVFPHHSSRLSYHLRTHTSSYIRCLEIVLVLRHGDFSSLVFHEYLHIACGRIFLAHLSAVVYSYARTTVYARIRGTFECALSKYLPRCKAACLLNAFFMGRREEDIEVSTNRGMPIYCNKLPSKYENP